MSLGLIQYVFGWKDLGTAGLRPPTASSPEAFANAKRQAAIYIGIGVVVFAVLGTLIGMGTIEVTRARVTTVFTILLLTVTIGIFGSLFASKEWTAVERGRLYMIGVYFIAAALFWGVFEQAGSTLNLFALERTNIGSPTALAPGKHTITYEFIPDTAKPGTGGKSILSLDGKKVAEGQIPKTQPFAFSADEGADVGLDGETNVSPDYNQGDNAFTGKIIKVTVAQK